MSELVAYEARLSSVYTSNGWLASAAIDGDLTTLCLSSYSVGAWLAVRVGSEAAVGRVDVYNRDDGYAYLLGEIEVWAGGTYGDTSATSATRCAAAQTAPSAPREDPIVFDCAGVRGKPYLTLRQLGPQRYLSILEMKAFG